MTTDPFKKLDIISNGLISSCSSLALALKCLDILVKRYELTEQQIKDLRLKALHNMELEHPYGAAYIKEALNIQDEV